MIFKTFVGATVLNIEHFAAQEGPVRIYCHCTYSRMMPSSITLYGMNLKSEEVHIHIPGLPAVPVLSAYTYAYILTGEDGLQSK